MTPVHDPLYDPAPDDGPNSGPASVEKRPGIAGGKALGNPASRRASSPAFSTACSFRIARAAEIRGPAGERHPPSRPPVGVALDVARSPMPLTLPHPFEVNTGRLWRPIFRGSGRSPPGDLEAGLFRPGSAGTQKGEIGRGTETGTIRGLEDATLWSEGD